MDGESHERGPFRVKVQVHHHQKECLLKPCCSLSTTTSGSKPCPCQEREQSFRSPKSTLVGQVSFGKVYIFRCSVQAFNGNIYVFRCSTLEESQSGTRHLPNAHFLTSRGDHRFGFFARETASCISRWGKPHPATRRHNAAGGDSQPRSSRFSLWWRGRRCSWWRGSAFIWWGHGCRGGYPLKKRWLPCECASVCLYMRARGLSECGWYNISLVGAKLNVAHQADTTSSPVLVDGRFCFPRRIPGGTTYRISSVVLFASFNKGFWSKRSLQEEGLPAEHNGPVMTASSHRMLWKLVHSTSTVFAIIHQTEHSFAHAKHVYAACLFEEICFRLYSTMPKKTMKSSSHRGTWPAPKRGKARAVAKRPSQKVISKFAKIPYVRHGTPSTVSRP